MHALGHLLHTWVHGGASGENSIGVQVFPEVIGSPSIHNKSEEKSSKILLVWRISLYALVIHEYIYRNGMYFPGASRV
jgi:hypothetical protein